MQSCLTAMRHRRVTYQLWLTLAIVLVGTCVLQSCRFKQKELPRVAVTVKPQQYFLEKIAGNKIEVLCLLAEDSNPETYKPGNAGVLTIERCEAYFIIGHIGYEYAIVSKIKNNNPHFKVYDTSTGIDLINSPAGHQDVDSDPHVWNSVKNARIIVKNMLDALVELDPRNKGYYTRRYEKLIAEINALDAEISNVLTQSPPPSFVVWHPSLSYFARDYGLTQISLDEGKKMSRDEIKTRLKEASRQGANVMFYQKLFDGDLVGQQCESLNMNLVKINPMSYAWDNEMRAITAALAQPQ